MRIAVSIILWISLVIWSLLMGTCTLAVFVSEPVPQTPGEYYQAQANAISGADDQAKAGAALILFMVWGFFALPLFITALVTMIPRRSGR